MKASLVVRVDGATPIILNGEKSIILGILGTLSPWRSTKLSPGKGKQCADATSMRPRSSAICLYDKVRLARTILCATVGSATRNARAISSVVKPQAIAVSVPRSPLSAARGDTK